MKTWRYVMPDAQMVRIATALCEGDKSAGQLCVNEAPKGTHSVDIQIRFKDKNGAPICETLGFEILTPEGAKAEGVNVDNLPSLPTKRNLS